MKTEERSREQGESKREKGTFQTITTFQTTLATETTITFKIVVT